MSVGCGRARRRWFESASERPKQLAIFQGEPLVRRIVTAAKDAGCAPVVVVVGADAAQITPVLAGLPVSIIEHPNWSNGLGSSIAVGVKHAEHHYP